MIVNYFLMLVFVFFSYFVWFMRCERKKADEITIAHKMHENENDGDNSDVGEQSGRDGKISVCSTGFYGQYGCRWLQSVSNMRIHRPCNSLL